VWLYALGLPLAFNEALLKPLFPETHALIGDWYTFNHYFLFTVYGVLLASMRNAWDWFATRRQLSLGITLVVFGIAMLLLETGAIHRNTPADAFAANIFTWAALTACIGYGRRYLSFSNPLLRWARDASYRIYILHQTVIVAIGYWIIQQPWNAWTKYAVVLLGTMAICVALYEGIRRVPLTRLLFGMKALRKTPTADPRPSPAFRAARIADDVA